MGYTPKVICDVNEWQDVLVVYNGSPARFILIRIERSWPDCVLTPASKKRLRRGASFELFQQLRTGCSHRLFSPFPDQLVFFFLSTSDKPIPWFWRLRISSFIWLYLSTSDKIKRNSSSEILSSARAADTLSEIVLSFESARTRIWLCFFSVCLKLPAYKFSAGSQQATHNRSSLNANGDRYGDDCWQESNPRSG